MDDTRHANLMRNMLAGVVASAELQPLRAFVLTGPTTPTAAACAYQSARFDDMATPFALLAWGRALPLVSFEESTALDFARTWIEVTGPERNSC